MASKQLAKRSEVEVIYKWQLEDLFANLEEWEQEFRKIKQMLETFPSFQGKLADPQVLKRCLELDDQIGQMTERVYAYAHMRHHEDTSNGQYQALSERATHLTVEVSNVTSFISPELTALPDDVWDTLLHNESLSFYKNSLEQLVRMKPHVLTEAEEAILAQASVMANAPQTIFTMINNADMRFPEVKDEQGNEVELTHSRYGHLMESKDRNVRQQAFAAMYDTYRKQKNTIATTLTSNVSKNIFYSRVRKYPSVLESALYGDNIPSTVYTNLIETVHAYLPLLYRYFSLRKQALGVDELHLYDLYCPLQSDFDWKITYEEAKHTVAKALQVLGEDYVSQLREGFENGWIDVYENVGKRSGAYSWGAYGTHPYVLLNHQDNVRSMFTLAHEMGHALHSHYSDHALPYRYAQYTIFLAEVASTTNEALLMEYLLKSANVQQRLYLLTYYADQFKSTVFRQTMFAEFEKIVHERMEQGEALTADELSKIYYELNLLYHGDAVTVDRDIELEWARIPHFYTSFYVYKYATGFSAATAFAKQVIEQGQEAVDRYIQKFLQAGGKDYSIEILKAAGVDMSSPEPIRQAFAVFESVLDQLEEVLRERK
ncbi:oligoendopeptidase F [Fodinisporobacter ferrooxydans]|uniref:Oligopeptidase F n=1 Tax=Fodinisporobacter ferrooxydans TaxID=2901836 RepID=A0ABY4CHE4_9BACL|nr:oligoendopeptidase F [Alicyclobacillaceae bacterium MYW30-H2]